jgi:hypothetical protein
MGRLSAWHPVVKADLDGENGLLQTSHRATPTENPVSYVLSRLIGVLPVLRQQMIALFPQFPEQPGHDR